MRVALAIVLLLITPSLAFAHTGQSNTMGFLHGWEHPLGGIDHVLAMLAVGVFAYVLGGRALWLVPLSFVSMMIVGFIVGAGQFDLPFVELGIAISSIAIGGAAALNRPMPFTAAMGLVGVFAVFHGYAHGAEMPLATSAFEYAAGFVSATTLLHVAGVAGAMVVAKLLGRHGKAAAQLAGGIFALGGIGVLGGWL